MIVGPLSLILFLSFVVVVVSFCPHDDIKRGSVLSILCCSCSMIVVLFTAVPSSTRHICTDEIKKKMLPVIYCCSPCVSMHIWISCAIFLFREIVQRKKKIKAF